MQEAAEEGASPPVALPVDDVVDIPLPMESGSPLQGTTADFTWLATDGSVWIPQSTPCSESLLGCAFVSHFWDVPL